MRGIGIAGLLVGAVVLAGCSERSSTTAPSAPLASAAALSAAGFIGDRPYTWSLKCSGVVESYASWSWTAAGAPITGSEKFEGCGFSATFYTGTGVRPAAADGLSACVNSSCETWSFDPTGSFKAQLKGSRYEICIFKCNNKPLATATLNVDS
ncbi:MAG: hypothetical protein AUH78_20610 [Gemmatimonadetes bacterium 13_1_40CM_4_69_8]|uniref:Uncharacterized protein n=1 Tax=Candidatus Segetimicrobium genomatis TaxID=2569760 RepID=A0A537IRD7_9BACT|nr:MAG: hypothetical protein AUH78_20610 [Gemmatimonadetes bacterium 13_1_40CM_4_69_8]TMI73901.1 MAG: hypothetical protein E6H05_08575 [Terrabacteria group bacterium ANGP1]